jgi:hypothetical protein
VHFSGKYGLAHAGERAGIPGAAGETLRSIAPGTLMIVKELSYPALGRTVLNVKITFWLT